MAGRLWIVAGALIAPSLGSLAADETEEHTYLQADTLLSGKEMHTFTTNGETGNVVLGDFSLSVGDRTISARDAVVWMKETRLGDQVLREIDVYAEGNSQHKAKVVEPDGTTTTDRVIYVSFRQRGVFRARVGRHGQQDIRSLPIFGRALAMRATLASPADVEAPTDADRPAVLPTPVTTRTPATTSTPALRQYQPVAFRADTVKVRMIDDPRDPDTKLRITIATGSVYLSQGSADSDLFMEMQADSAVIYTGPRTNADGETSEEIIGAYLEGNVVMRRGERTIRGKRLFYDFRSGRAIILQPVLRTVQEQRKIPVYIRAREGRQTAAWADPKNEDLRIRGYKWKFRNAIVTTSDFHTPQYHIGAWRAYLEDATLYDEKDSRISERRWRSKLVGTTLNIRSVPVFWWPYTTGNAEEGHTAVRKAQIGRHGRYGFGGETEWYLFRLLGVPKPDGFKGQLDANWYERGFILGTTVKYDRPHYSGYAKAYGVFDQDAEDDFGTDREDIPAPRQRGRLLWRHKQFLPRAWQLQLEASYLCDENFLEEFFPREFHVGKPQETLLYAKKQHDNMALTILGQWRINDFLTQTEAYPDVAGYIIGQSLWNDRLTLHSEGRVGMVRYRPADSLAVASSPPVARADLREELNVPFALGPVKFLPFITGRATYWEDTPGDGGLFRPWGQVGINATTHFWRINKNVQSRLWDLHQIRHIITPYGRVFTSYTDVRPQRVYPFGPEVELHIRQLDGGTVGVRQLWQTKRGAAGERQSVDWLRWDISGSVFNNDKTNLPSDGRYFFYRPEHSLSRNAINTDVAWHVSDSTTILADANYDVDTGGLGRGNIGVAVSRDPRLRYYLGIRAIRDLDSAVGTFGMKYKLNRKYTLNFFEQYDFDFDGGENQATSLSIVRKFPRLYMAFTFVFDRTQNDVGLFVTVWPEGIEEIRIGGTRVSLLQGSGGDD